MAEIIKSYRQSVPAMRFIGKKYSDDDRIDGSFSAKWGEWFANGWFAVVEKQTGISIKETYEDGDAYIGLMRWRDGEPFELFPELIISSIVELKNFQFSEAYHLQ